MSHQPLVSCIIIFLNAEKFLSESINSVLGQTYEAWELLLVDDGSTDDSSAIAREFAAKYPEKIIYLEHEDHQNHGANISRNLGIGNARGVYIALLDADDVWLEDKLADQVALMEANPEAGMLYGRTQIWLSWDKTTSKQTSDTFFELGVEPDALIPPPDLFFDLIEGWAQSPTTCNAIMRKSVIDQVGGFDESFHMIGEDLAFFAKIELAYPVFVAGKVWARYRQHPGSIMAKHFEASAKDRSVYYEARLALINWIERYLVDKEYTDQRVWRSLRHRKKAVRRNLLLVRHPVTGSMTLSMFRLLEWFLGAGSAIGRKLLPAKIRNWLWVRIGKKMYVNL